jgi:uncharacterized RDD family membrane protein YckC
MDATPALSVNALAIELYATWGRRLGAWLIDALLVWGASFVFDIVATSSGGDFGYSVVFFLLTPLYFTLCHGGPAGQTLGKRAVGIAVRDGASLGRLSYARALARWLVTALFWLLLLVPGLLDGLWPLRDRKRQTWHDKIVGSVVIQL